jgi:ABC-type Fe3+-siderophore transport system permease subunit
MSIGSRIVIGVFALLCAASFFMTARDPSGLPIGAWAFYSLAAFCIVIATACFFPQTHPFTLRLIGIVIFVTYVAYVWDSFHTQNLARAIQGFLFWGVPSGYLAIVGKYPSWGKGAKGLKGKRSDRR